MMKNKLLKKVMTGVLAGAMVISGLTAGSTPKTAQAADNSMLNLNGKYHAALGIQTATVKWYERLAYYGKKNNKNYGTDKANVLMAGKEKTAGKFTDVEIAGNGTYTVSLSGANFNGETTISQLHVATDIPGKDSNSKISFSDVKVTINDKEVVSFDTPYLEPEQYNADGMVLVMFNHWRQDLVSILNKKGIKEDAENGYKLLKGKGKESVSVTFTVSGFNYNKGETPEGGDDIVDLNPAPKLGAIKKAAGYTYKVTKSAKKNGTVTLVTGKKNVKKASVPASIKIKGYTFKVTAIEPSAFAGNKKLTSVKIGKNVTSIGAKAFSSCAKLDTIDLSKNTSLKSVGKSAIKGVAAKCVVKAPKSKKAAYKKLFSGKGKKVTVE